MQTPARLLGLVLLSLLWSACPKPSQTKQGKATPPVQRALRDVMLRAGEHLSAAGPIASETSDFIAAARGVASAMKTTRDLYAPDPGFYQLADEAFHYATESAAPGEPALRAQAWSNTQQACQRCHLRYGGPKTSAP